MTNLQSRITQEIYKLTAKNFTVKFIDPRDLEVVIQGPDQTPFVGGRFLVNITIPDDYPFRSPSIGFGTRIFHPNIDENSGSVCLDVLNQVWSPMYDLSNIVEMFLPQLLSYPNPLDPLNSEAAQLYSNDILKYECVVKEYIKMYCVKNEDDDVDDDSGIIDSDDVDL